MAVTSLVQYLKDILCFWETKNHVGIVQKAQNLVNVPYRTANFVDQVRGNKHDWEGYSACTFVGNALIENGASSLTFWAILVATKCAANERIQKEKLLIEKYFSITLNVLSIHGKVKDLHGSKEYIKHFIFSIIF